MTIVIFHFATSGASSTIFWGTDLPERRKDNYFLPLAPNKLYALGRNFTSSSFSWNWFRSFISIWFSSSFCFSSFLKKTAVTESLLFSSSITTSSPSSCNECGGAMKCCSRSSLAMKVIPFARWCRDHLKPRMGRTC